MKYSSSDVFFSDFYKQSDMKRLHRSDPVGQGVSSFISCFGTGCGRSVYSSLRCRKDFVEYFVAMNKDVLWERRM